MRRLPALLFSSPSRPRPRGADVPDEARLRAMTARFAPVDIGADVSALPESERRALVKMIEAARVLDGLYLRQVWGGNEALLLDLLADRSPLGQARLHAFLLDKGPWSSLDHGAPFLPGVPAKPEEANFYPAGATKAEVEAWMKGLPEAERAAAQGFFTTIRRAPDGKLVAVPYSVEYQGELARAAELLREAAAATTQPTLKAFLEKRAAAFLSNDYYASDVAWMELDASLEPTIGPYETYDDGWFGYKAAFEAFIAVRDEKETAKLARFSSELQWLEDRLPIDPAFRNPKLGGMAPIRVVDVVFSSGQGNSGVQTAAYNLPNDEKVVAEKGAKRVMLKNTQKAKFERVLVPISKVALAPADQPNVDFEVFFTHILMHELMHGLGPGNIRVRRPGDHCAPRAQGHLRRHRGGEGRHRRPVGAPAARGQGGPRPLLRADDVHDLPRLGLPLDPLRHRRGPREGAGPPAQPPARRGRLPGGPRRHVLRGRGEGEAGRHRPHPRADDAGGGGQLRARRRPSSSGWPSSGRRRSGCSTG